MVFQQKVELFGSSLPPVGELMSSYLHYLCIVMFNTYCVVFLFFLSSSCVPYVGSFSGFFIFDCPFGVF